MLLAPYLGWTDVFSCVTRKSNTRGLDLKVLAGWRKGRWGSVKEQTWRSDPEMRRHEGLWAVSSNSPGQHVLSMDAALLVIAAGWNPSTPSAAGVYGSNHLSLVATEKAGDRSTSLLPTDPQPKHLLGRTSEKAERSRMHVPSPIRVQSRIQKRNGSLDCWI